MLKPNLWKIWETEGMENLHQPLCTLIAEIVNVTMNVLSVETSSSMNIETEPRTKWCGDRETEPADPGIWRNRAHYSLSAESSQLMNIEIDPDTWRGVHL